MTFCLRQPKRSHSVIGHFTKYARTNEFDFCTNVVDGYRVLNPAHFEIGDHFVFILAISGWPSIQDSQDEYWQWFQPLLWKKLIAA